MDLLFYFVLSAALVAGLITLLKWAQAEDRKTSLRERFNRVIEDWGKEK
jgi:sensor c-di-GMP phosphodiesterase-like protein